MDVIDAVFKDNLAEGHSSDVFRYGGVISISVSAPPGGFPPSPPSPPPAPAVTAAAGFACAIADATCAALADVYAATGAWDWCHLWSHQSSLTCETGGTTWIRASEFSNYSYAQGWDAAAEGVPTSYCSFAGVGCDTSGTPLAIASAPVSTRN